MGYIWLVLLYFSLVSNHVCGVPKPSVSCKGLYNPADGKCYKFGDRATCPETMVMVADYDFGRILKVEEDLKNNENVTFGTCGCSDKLYYPQENKCYEEGDTSVCGDPTLTFVRDYKAGLSQETRFKYKTGSCACADAMRQSPCGHFPVLQHPMGNRCYEMFTQGPCAADEWFVPVLPVDHDQFSRLPGTCTKNTCAHLTNSSRTNSTNPSAHVYAYNGACYTTFTRGHCGDPDSVAYFNDNDPYPYCEEPAAFQGCKRAKVCNDGLWYHEATDQCYRNGARGPCPDTMVFAAQDFDQKTTYERLFGKDLGIIFGKCDCVTGKGPLRCLTAERPYLFSPSLQKCVPAFSQGPCEDSEWYVPGTNFEAKKRLVTGVCEPNQCLESRPSFPNVTIDEVEIFYFGVSGKCYLTGTRADCEDVNKVAIFSGTMSHMCLSERSWKGSLDGTCEAFASQFWPSSSTGPRSLGCGFGYRKRGQECVQESDF